MGPYAGTFLIAFSTLALEVTLTRILSVATWYHLAFFAISTAMLGMTAGATTVFLRPAWFAPERARAGAGAACLGYAAVTPLALLLLCLLPLELDRSLTSALSLLLATAAAALPFYFSGIAVTTVLTKFELPIGRLYAADLVGASLGCLFVLGGLEVLDAPSLVIACGAVGALAALAFDRGAPRPRFRRAHALLFVGLALFAAGNAASPRGLRPLVVKGNIIHPSQYLSEKWNSFSRVLVFPQVTTFPQLWGPSPAAPAETSVQHFMNIDGEAGTTIRRFQSTADIQHLRYDVTNAAYAIRPSGGACVIGVGGGRDVQSALLFGHRRIVGVEVNPIFIRLLQGPFRAFASLAGRPEVELVVDEARSYLSRTPERFAVIQMSLIDTWASTGAGAFSLSENALYTREAWRVFIERLAPEGVFTVSRWYNRANLGETGRAVSLAVAALMDAGVREPRRHVAMLTSGRVATLLVSRAPLGEADVDALVGLRASLRFETPILPGVTPQNERLRGILAADSAAALAAAVADPVFNYAPPSDESPYFFNMLRPGALGSVFERRAGVVQGNITATATLVALLACLAALTAATILVPLLARRRGAGGGDARVRLAPALYFSLIGAGFMFLEIGLMQRLSVFLGHPVYALGILLFGIIASTGVGSWLSDRVRAAGRPLLLGLPLATAGAIVAARYLIPAVVARAITAPMGTKIGIAVAAIAPLGVLLGFFFPLGMRLVRAAGGDETPWYWALNGIFGVLCSALAVFVSINFGIGANFLLAAACYAALAGCARSMG